MPAHDEFFRRSLHRLRDFRLYLPNPTFCNPRWEESRFHALIVRLSPFSDVDRSTTHSFLAGEVRAALPDAYIDMAFLPLHEDARVLEEAGLPLLIGTQSHRSLGEFELVFVSNSWLLEQVNLPFLLMRSGVPVWTGARGEQWPPLILGGSNSTAAHALVSETGDCVADAIFFGEGERSAGRIARMCASLAAMPKRERMARIASEVVGLWPAGNARARVRSASSCEADDSGAGPVTPVLPGPESATSRLLITRGCPCLCSFCFEGHARRPFRQIPSAELLRSARELKMRTGADTLEIESFNFNTHSEIAVLLHDLNRLFSRVNLMSQRVDILARTPGLIDLEIAADKRSFTLGIEGISERLRRFLRKSLEEEDIRRVLEALHARRTRELKLFYLLTGRETTRDFAEFAHLVKWLKNLRMKAEAAPRILFSFGMLVRMPRTPLRHDPPLLEEPAWRQLDGRAKSICETNSFEFRLALPWPEYAATQVIALGGHSLHPLLERLAREGCVAEKGLSREGRNTIAEWVGAHHEELAGEKPRGHPFPFSFLEDAETTEYLHREYEEAKSGRDPGYCRRGTEGSEECAECPGCTRSPRSKAGGTPGLAEAASGVRDLMSRKHRLKPVHVRARIPREAAGLGAPWAEAWLLRRLLRDNPEQLENVLSVREVLVTASGVLGEETPWFGETVVAVTAWDTTGLEKLFDHTGDAFGAILHEWEPGAFHTMRLLMDLPGSLFADAPGSLSAFLRDAHAPVTLSRSGGILGFVAGDKSLKKKMLLGGSCARTEDGYRLDLLIGAKLSLGKWMRSTAEEGAARGVLVEIKEST
jgi:radical SAM superfamily enzyme YgiQ (UPF0313 family)